MNEYYLMKNFGASAPAASHRVKTLNSRFYLTADEKIFDDIIVEKYRKFIDKVAPKKLEYSYSCWDDPMQKERDSWY